MDGWFRLCGRCVSILLPHVGEWLWENQAYKACTFDSPGLATIGAYPGEGSGRKSMPSALYFL